MKRHLKEVLESIAEEYGENILDGARNYLEIDIGKRAEVLGYPKLEDKVQPSIRNRAFKTSDQQA